MTQIVVDEAEKDLTVSAVQYKITSYGADFDVEGLVRRLERDVIFIPNFQRDYVWTLREASRFIESLLLGLPVPGIFLARDPKTKKLLVIDGQQRLKTLSFFMNGYFNPRPDAKSKRVFKLVHVQAPFEGKTYETLKREDQLILNDSIIHATIVQQDEPKDDDTSIYHIFERLNASGRKLSPQQIRVAIYHGVFIDMLRELNDHANWREMFGNYSLSLKDQELILRFLAFYDDEKNYKRPMKEFLNKYAKENRNISQSSIEDYKKLFKNTIDFVFNSIGPRAFRPERALNAAVFDSVMTCLAHKLADNPEINPKNFRKAYKELFLDENFLSSYAEGTSDERNVEKRFSIVRSKLSHL